MNTRGAVARLRRTTPRIPLTGSIADDAAGKSSLTRFGLALCDHRSGYRGHGTLEDQYRSQACHIGAGISPGDDDIDGRAAARVSPSPTAMIVAEATATPTAIASHASEAQICTLDGDGDACQARAGRGNGNGCASGASPGTRGRSLKLLLRVRIHASVPHASYNAGNFMRLTTVGRRMASRHALPVIQRWARATCRADEPFRPGSVS
jgi:hypothetical protein